MPGIHKGEQKISVAAELFHIQNYDPWLPFNSGEEFGYVPRLSDHPDARFTTKGPYALIEACPCPASNQHGNHLHRLPLGSASWAAKSVRNQYNVRKRVMSDLLT